MVVESAKLTLIYPQETTDSETFYKKYVSHPLNHERVLRIVSWTDMTTGTNTYTTTAFNMLLVYSPNFLSLHCITVSSPL